jgi:hypothetical protein
MIIGCEIFFWLLLSMAAETRNLPKTKLVRISIVAVGGGNHSYQAKLWTKTVLRFPLEYCLSWVEFTTWLHKRVFEIEHSVGKGVEQ